MAEQTITTKELIAQLEKFQGQVIANPGGLAAVIMKGAEEDARLRIKRAATAAGKDQAMGIDNTAAQWQDPAERYLMLLESAVAGSADSYIGRQESEGQRQLALSGRLPADRHGDFEALGFTFGDPDTADPLLCPATLPPGWSRKAKDDAPGSAIVDELGRERVIVFYKAAFYDRSASMTLVSLDWYVKCSVECDRWPIVLDDQWASREAVAAVMRRARDRELAEAAEFRGYSAARDPRRDAASRGRCAGIADEHEAVAAKYDAALASLAGEGGTDGG